MENLEKQKAKVAFMVAVNMLIAGGLASENMDFDDVIDCLAETQDHYVAEMKKNDDKIMKSL